MSNYSAVPVSTIGENRRTGQLSVVNALGAAILSGDFAIGANLPNEAELTARFSVSRTVIREVMKTLAAKGLVIAKTKIGTRVADKVNWNMFDSDVILWRCQAGIDGPFLKNLFEIRLAVEPTGAALAAERRTDADMVNIRRCLNAMAAPGHSNYSFVAADLEFHIAIAIASYNPFMTSIRPVIEASLNGSLTSQSPVNNANLLRIHMATHTAVADAIEAGDARGARRAMIEVIDDGILARGGDLKGLPT